MTTKVCAAVWLYLLHSIQLKFNVLNRKEQERFDNFTRFVERFFSGVISIFYPYLYVGFFSVRIHVFFWFISSSMLVMLVFRFSIETMHNFQCSFVSFVHLRTVPFLQLIFFMYSFQRINYSFHISNFLYQWMHEFNSQINYEPNDVNSELPRNVWLANELNECVYMQKSKHYA